MHTPLPLNFYLRNNVVQIARELIGKALCTCIDGHLAKGIIVETEAYCGATDQACHAYGGRRTRRTETMFGTGGKAYVYLCYGIHHLFNIVTNVEGQADAVLIRAVEPLVGLDNMLRRRGIAKAVPGLTAGPGSLSKALGITTFHNGTKLDGVDIWLENPGQAVPDSDVLASPRVGVGYAGEDALLPWRFRRKGNPWCSKAK